MRRNKDIGRRDVLRMIAMLLPTALGASAGLRWVLTDDQPLSSIFQNLPDLVALGRLYVRAHPGEVDPDDLVAKMADLDPDSFAHQVERCFRTGRTVALDGWILSEAEAQLCGSLYLISEQAERGTT